MTRPEYLDKYIFDWETFDVMLSGKSAIDAKKYLSTVKEKADADLFISGYGFDALDPIVKAELFGNYQEALAFIKRYFLKEGNPEGLDLKIPNFLYMLTDVSHLFFIASGNSKQHSIEESIWAGIVLKVMHTFMHTDRDLRSHYFSQIQKQIFDRFYRYINRENDQLFLKDEKNGLTIPLIEFQTKSKKSRDSTVIKLLHKVENVAEELFDKIGIRIITESRVDCLKIVRFLHTNYVVLAHNVKPSRSINSLVDLKHFKEAHYQLIKDTIRNNLSEEEFLRRLEENAKDSLPVDNPAVLVNKHTSQKYRSIQFTCRQLIHYRNPIVSELNQIRKIAKESNEQSELVKRILQMDTSTISRDVSFFYPFEIQINDLESYKQNQEGEASHQEYKKAQVQTAMKRVFKTLLDYKGISL